MMMSFLAEPSWANVYICKLNLITHYHQPLFDDRGPAEKFLALIAFTTIPAFFAPDFFTPNFLVAGFFFLYPLFRADTMAPSLLKPSNLNRALSVFRRLCTVSVYIPSYNYVLARSHLCLGRLLFLYTKSIIRYVVACMQHTHREKFLHLWNSKLFSSSFFLIKRELVQCFSWNRHCATRKIGSQSFRGRGRKEIVKVLYF